MASRWGILCPGPSLSKHNPFLYDIDFTVAVNGAILDPQFCPDYWAMCDLEVFASCVKEYECWSPRIKLWIPARWLDDVKPESALYNAFQKFEKETFPSETNEAFAATMPFKNDILWRERTLFIAIGQAIKKGAKEIWILGADMAGRGYFREGLENSRTRHTEKRWEEEIYWFNRIVKVCAEQGITVIKE